MSSGRNYYTTGVYAAAAAKAAARNLLTGSAGESEEVALGKEIVAAIPIIENYGEGLARWAAVRKEGGTDADATKGAVIRAAAEIAAGSGNDDVLIAGGSGVGRVTEPGLAAAVGEPAINPVPRKMIEREVNEIRKMAENMGPLRITISVDGGTAIAKKTFNPKLGIKDGISIIGTTGLVRPMSEDSWKESLLPQIDMALAAGYDKPALVFGNIGERTAVGLGFAGRRVIQISNFVGYMLEACRERGVKSAILIGHLGKVIKIADGHLNTHSRTAPQDTGFILSLAEREGLSKTAITGIKEAKSTEAIIQLPMPYGKKRKIFDDIASTAEKKLRSRFVDMNIYVAVTDLAGNIAGAGREAVRILEDPDRW